jgi:UDP-N-acetylglucosamine 2-epimerase (non-hydrolysing)
MAAALAAFYLRIPVGHVEAGLRTSSISEPFPEEMNRRVADIIAAHYYCPTEGAADNLRSGRWQEGEIFVTGNTALDAVRLTYSADYRFLNPRLEAFARWDGPRLLVTAHRRENWGLRMETICQGILAVLADQPQAMVCFCWHPNPVVRESVQPLLGGNPRVLLIDPPRFDIFVNLLGAADLVLTDSGGIQEEVTMLRRFALVLRSETERPEAVDSGFARLVGTDAQAIRKAVAESLELKANDRLIPAVPSPFGDGHAADRIVAAILQRFGLEG